MTTVNINRNRSLMALQELVEQNIDNKLSYMPESFNKQQTEALELFKQRVFLEKTIDESISFNQNLKFENTNKNLHLVKSAEELIEVFKLRSDVFKDIQYQSQFPDTIEGLNFDAYDSTSAILFYGVEKQITGSVRVIFDTEEKLPSEKNFPFDNIRKEYNILGELSRLVVKNNQKKGLNQEFKYLFGGIHNVFINNDIDILLSCIKVEHLKLYNKFGGTTRIDGTDNFGSLHVPIHIMLWDPSQVSSFFKKAFLN